MRITAAIDENGLAVCPPDNAELEIECENVYRGICPWCKTRELRILSGFGFFECWSCKRQGTIPGKRGRNTPLDGIELEANK